MRSIARALAGLDRGPGAEEWIASLCMSWMRYAKTIKNTVNELNSPRFGAKAMESASERKTRKNDARTQTRYTLTLAHT